MGKENIHPMILRILIESKKEDNRVSETNTNKGYLSERFIAEKLHKEYDLGYKESAYQPMVNEEISNMEGKRYKYDGEEYVIETETENGPGPNNMNIARAMEVD